jgi:uncharacterized protein
MKLVAALSIGLSAFLSLPAAAASPDIVVSQVYGGGGNSGATLTHDFIELFNRGPVPVDVSGWSVQYASAAGATWQRTLLTGSILPGQHYLVQQAMGAGGSVGLPVPDAVGVIPMSATAGKIALVNGGTLLAGTCPTAGVVDFVGYGAANCFEGIAASALNNTTAALRAVSGCTDTDINSADFASGVPNPRNTGAAFNVCGAPTPTPAPIAHIREIQGAGHLSPLSGTAVSGVTGIVTAVRLNGFFIQDPSPDADDATSEAVFIFTNTVPTVSVGDGVSVSGLVAEFRASSTSLTITEIASPVVAVTSSGNALPPATILGRGGRVPPTEVIEDDAVGSVETSGVFDPATDGIDFYESLEGLRVQIDVAVAVGRRSGNGEIPVLVDDGADAVLRTPRGGVVVRSTDFNPERIFLDDAFVPLPETNVGDRFSSAITGVLDYSFGNFKLLVTAPVTVVPGGLLPETAPELGPHHVAIATFNVENLDPADAPEKFAALASTIVDRLHAPDMIAVEEVQDDSGPVNDGIVGANATFQALIAAIVAAGGPTYDYRQIDPVNGRDGGESGGNIRQGLLFRTDRGIAFVDRPGGDAMTATSVVAGPSGPVLTFSPGRIDPAHPSFANSRKPLALELRVHGQTLFVIANHFNAKGGDQPLFGRFQPPVRSTEIDRRQQAQIVADFVRAILTLDPAAAVVVLGDINDFEFSDSVQILKASGLTPLIETLPPAERYTYVFEGNSQALDHTLVSGALLGRPFLYDVVHVNAEFATRSSDHDPQVAHLLLGVAPAITSAPVTTARQNIAYVYDVETSGAPAPRFVLDTAPTGMTIDPLTGRIDWTPLVLPGSYAVTVRATNGIGPDAVQSFDVRVLAAPRRKVDPTVECATRNGDGTSTARLGYRNPNPFAVAIPIGLRNLMLPLPLDRGQPRVFEPGANPAAFEVTFRGPALLWILDGNLAIASPFLASTCAR